MIIIHGGQTGVDRGAHYGALAAGHEIEGYCPMDGADEDGPIPRDVMRHLERPIGNERWMTKAEQYHERTELNVMRASHVLILVDRRVNSPGTALTIKLADKHGRPCKVLTRADFTPQGQLTMAGQVAIQDWLRVTGATKLMVAGPRGSRWPGGFDLAFSLVREDIG